MARLARLWLGAFAQVLRARLRRGPLRPSWSLLLKATVAYLRADLAELSRWPIVDARVALEARPLPRAAIARVRRTVVADGPLRGEWFRSPPQERRRTAARPQRARGCPAESSRLSTA